MPDLLGHHPARPDTIVPGRWILDLDHSPAFLHARVFLVPPEDQTADLPHAEGSQDAHRRLDRAIARRQLLDEAWRAINSQHANETDRGMRGLLQMPSAYIAPKRASIKAEDGRAPETNASELWLFEMRGPNASVEDRFHHHVLDSLEERTSQASSFRISELVSCGAHATPLDCLCTRDGASMCDVRFRPGKYAPLWERFAKSLVEKMSWRLGTRARMDDAAALTVDLRPLAHNRVLLAVHNKTRTPGGASQGHVQLCPFDLAAFPVAPYEPSPEQEARLDSAFASALGSGWKNDKAAWTIGRQLASQDTSAWTIYWVRTEQLSPEDPEAEARGVLAIWPTHLASPSVTPSRQAKKRKRLTMRDPSPTDLTSHLAAASSLFDFFASYKDAPTPIDLIETEIVKNDTPETGGSRADTRIAADSVVTSTDAHATDDKPRSETDDLFSSRSASLDPAQNTTEAVVPSVHITDVSDVLANPDGTGDAGSPTRERRAIFDDDVTMGGTTPPQPSSRASYYGDEGMGAITEHDFDFFDDMDGDESGTADAAVGQSTMAELDVDGAQGATDTGPNEADTRTGQRSGTPITQGDVEIAQEPMEPRVNGADNDEAGMFDPGHSHTTEVPPACDSADQSAAETVNVVGDTMANLRPEGRDKTEPTSPHSSSVDSTAVTAVQSADTADGAGVQPARRLQPIEGELIPSAFGPIALTPAPQMTERLHRITTPAPSPESLRTDLVERLRGKSKPKNDYAAAWTIDDTPSETEADYDDSGAPPTPESIDGWLDSINADTPASDIATPRQDVEFEGSKCLGAEWALSAGELAGEGVTDVAVPWKATWGPKPSYGAFATAARSLTTKRHPSKLLHRLATELIANQLFRDSLVSSQYKPESRPAIALDGSTLTDVLQSVDHESAAELLSQPSPTCDVHAGFAGNVLRLAIAGVTFWRELGLSPAGGAKDTEYVVVSLVKDGAVGTDRLLQQLPVIWESLRLGRHTPHPKSPYIETTREGLVETLSNVRATDSNNQIVAYVVLPNASISLPDELLATPSSTARIVHIVPASLQRKQLYMLAFDVYNRIPRLVQPVVSRSIGTAAAWYQYPSFTLAPDERPKPQITMSWPLRSYDIMNRWRMVHAAYSYNRDTGVAMAVVLDSEGENWRVQVWTDADLGGRSVHEAIYAFCAEFAATAAIEWHLVLARLGSPIDGEMERWTSTVSGDTPLTLIIVECGTGGQTGTVIPPSVPANVSNVLLGDKTSRLTDETMAYMVGRLHDRIPVDILPANATALSAEAVYPLASWMTTCTTVAAREDCVTALHHVCYHRAPPGKPDMIDRDEIEREFQRLTYLGRARFGFWDAGLPVHVQAVQSCCDVFRRMDG